MQAWPAQTLIAPLPRVAPVPHSARTAARRHGEARERYPAPPAGARRSQSTVPVGVKRRRGSGPNSVIRPGLMTSWRSTATAGLVPSRRSRWRGLGRHRESARHLPPIALALARGGRQRDSLVPPDAYAADHHPRVALLGLSDGDGEVQLSRPRLAAR
jgi:hypothetical protein